MMKTFLLSQAMVASIASNGFAQVQDVDLYKLSNHLYSVSPTADVIIPLKDHREVRVFLEKGAKFCGSYRISVGEQEVLAAHVSDPSMCALHKD